MTNSSPMLFSTIRRVLAESGVGEQVADLVVTEVGELYLDAVRDAVREHIDEGTTPRQSHFGLTETEASMCWCPMAREATPVGKGPKDAAIGNRYVDRDGSDYANPAGARCIGSMCTCWRWDSKRRGHCGLAGPIAYQSLGEPRHIPHRTPLERPTASEQADLFGE